MKRIITFYVFLLLILSSIFPLSSFASEKEAGNSAKSSEFAENSVVKTLVIDTRADTLKRYLEKYNSPLADYADTFVKEADNNNLDWKLVAAISGVESTFGQEVPQACNNAWGFGIYGDITTCFASYDGPVVFNDDMSINNAKSGAIARISKALREDYMDKWGEKDVFAIGASYAASEMWPYRVTYFMQDIQDFESKTEKISLPISL